MAIRKSRAGSPDSASHNSGVRSLRNRMRRMLVEDLEKRQMLAVGPQLIGIQPNNSDLIVNGTVGNVAPRELTFRFDDSQIIHPSTLSGIRITRAGGDGSFALNTISSDFGSAGAVDIQLTARVPGQTVAVSVNRVDLGLNAGPSFAVNGTNVTITLNSNFTTPTTAQRLVDAINQSTSLLTVVGAKINGGFASTVLGSINPASYSPLVLSQSGDSVITPGAVVVGATPNENEVTFRFAEALSNDLYRAEIFGFDDPVVGIVGLRNTSANGDPGDLFKPTNSNQRKDTIDFHIDLGPQITAVVPQPVVRTSTGALQQLRDTIVVYFDNDKLLVENDPVTGNPTSQSAENPEFYQLFFTDDTVRNTDDLRFLPQSVTYNASANTATLRFGQDLDTLPGITSGARTFRLRVGTRETTPITPQLSEAAANVISDFNTNGAVKFRFTAREIGESGSGIQINVTNSLPNAPAVVGAPPLITASGRSFTIDLRGNNVTAAQLVAALETSSASNNLVSIQLEPGSNPNTILNTPINYSPLMVVGVGSTFTTATNLGTIGSSNTSQTSLIVSSAIDPVPYNFDLIGGTDDPGTRFIPEEAGARFEQYINSAFGADRVDGITTIYYNFQLIYGTDSSGTPLVNAVTEKQRARAREALQIWGNKLGVQFVETPNLGITIATGSFSALSGTSPNVVITNSISMAVQIDPTFTNSRLILEASRQWGDNYGEDWFRAALTGMGMLLGLERGGDLPSGTLMALDTAFVNAGNSNFVAADEPVFPGNYDVVHGQYIFRPDSNDIDLYRFDVDFGGQDRVGLFVAETYAERQGNSSPLDTLLHLYKQKQATATSNLAAGESLRIDFEAVLPGRLGNNLQIFVTRSERGVGATPIVNVFDNLITVDLNSTIGQESTAEEFVNALSTNPAAAQLVKVTLAAGSGSTRIGNREVTYSPIVLQGGDVTLIARNDDYFSKDSFLQQSLGTGVYYIGVTASGNESYDPTIADTGRGGSTQGKYDLRLTFRAQVDSSDAIRDVAGGFVGDQSIAIDGDGDGIPGGTYNFWFQTRPLDRVLQFNAGASPDLEGKIVTVTGANGTVRRFEFSQDPNVGIGNTAIPYTLASTAGDLAQALANAIRSRSELAVGAIANGIRLTLQGERTVQLSAGLNNLEVQGRMIFVDKASGPNADGSLTRPFNNIAGTGVANAFASALPGDIVRIVGNGGGDGRIETVGDNYAYEIGFSLLGGIALTDGSSMDVPKGVTTMVDAGAVFKLRRARIGVGSSSLGVDRSGGALQILGTPALTDNNGRLLRAADGSAIPGSVFFTSWLDQTLGFDTYAPQTTPAVGDWGGISYRRDVDQAAGRSNLEDEGIFLQYVNHADIRFGGGGNVVIDSVQQVVNPIQIIDMRPTVTFNRISNSADAAMSAAPNSFEETNFNEPKYQLNGRFTSDYDRVGPDIRGNRLINNSLNGLFVRVNTPAGGEIRPLTVAARFDDIDIPYIISENIFITGQPGGSLLDTTRPLANLVALQATVGGVLLPGTYNYKVTFVDINGYETPASDATGNVTLNIGQTAVRMFGLPLTSGEYVARRIYRSNSSGGGQYQLVAQIDATSSGFTDFGQEAGGVLVRDRANVSGVLMTPQAGGSFSAGTYNYRLVMVDASGNDGIASDVTGNVTVTAGQRVQLNNLPFTQMDFSGRRLYRSAVGGVGPYTLVAELPNSTSSTITSVIDSGANLGTQLSPLTFGTVRPRLNASLQIDPGAVLKFEGARIEIGVGANLTAEGTDGAPVIFTSKLDDRYGAGGTFDTNNDGNRAAPAPRDWGGIYASSGSKLSLDYATVAYAGGVTKLEGTFKAFSPIEIQQADARITNSTFESNEDGIGGQGPLNRLGRLDNRPATIFVRGTQPILVGNTFLNNEGSAITIDANSMHEELLVDYGRSTGSVDRFSRYDSNRGPLIRENRMSNNELNGLEVRGDVLTTASVWDDTDIVHVLFTRIEVGNYFHDGGIRLQSSPTESLVIKLFGGSSHFDDAGPGFTATGSRTNAVDRIGGTVHVVGQPGFPVIMTSLRDDTVGAGLRPDGTPQTDTNNDGIGSVPQPGDWRSILLNQHSNDRNVATVLEIESPTAVAPGFNATTGTAQLLGDLASRPTASNETLRLGFDVHGVLSQPNDVDVYSFTAEAGTEIWIDVDNTAYTLDTVIELLNANGELLARSDNSTFETLDPDLITRTSAIIPSLVNPLPSRTGGVQRRHASGLLKEDGTNNPRDAGLRVVLPGSAGARSTYHFRVRSSSTNIEDFNAGLTSGSYQVQLRAREAQEFPGSTVQYADIRYATNGVELLGLPTRSPLLGEFQEDEAAGVGFFNNDVNAFNSINNAGPVGIRDQYLGNLLDTDRATISVGGQLSSAADLDFYRFEIRYEDLINPAGSGSLFAPVVFDMDYADGMNRADTSLAVYRVTGVPGAETYQLVLFGEDSNIADDIRGPLSLTDLEDFSRGSVGPKDPFIGRVALQAGTYMVAVSATNQLPTALSSTQVRRVPVNSIVRIADDQFDGTVSTATAAPPVVPFLFDRSFVGTGSNAWGLAPSGNMFRFGGAAIAQVGGAQGDLVSNAFSLANYSADDLPRLYFDYNLVADGNDSFEVLVTSPTMAPVVVASNAGPNALANTGVFNQAIVDLSQFAGRSDLRLVYRYNTNGTNAVGTGVSIDNVIIGFAERGEMILNAPTGAQYSTRAVPANTILSGHYQLEIRRAENFFTATGGGGLQLTSAMDTNDRAAEQVTLIAPEGRDLVDGDSFVLGDAGNQLTFEFDSNSSVTPGNVAIRFTATDTASTIAQRIRDAINDPGVQSRIKVRAASAGGVVAGSAVGDRVNLFGSVSGDLVTFNKPAMTITNPTTNAATLRNTILGAGITTTAAPAIYTGGAQSAGVVTFGGQTGIMLSTGRLSDALPPNLNDNSSGISSDAGDAQTDAALGVTTTDSTSLEFTFQFGTDGLIGGDLNLELRFLSEEFNEVSGQDVLAVFVDGVNIALVPGTGLPINSANINATTNSLLYYNNDLNDGGQYLEQTGFDGFTAPLRLTLPGLSAGPHTLKIVIADGGNKGTDSAVFVTAASMSTAVAPRTFGGIQAIFQNGFSDQNTNRDQGQVIIQNNFIRHSRDWAVVSEVGSRLRDPRDLLSNLAPFAGSAMSAIPAMAGNSPGAVRNLRELNDAQLGGFNTGIVVMNNVMESGGLGGVHIEGENPIYMITPNRPIPLLDGSPTAPSNPLVPDHYGTFVDDRDLLFIDAGRTRVQFEFEDIAGAPTGAPTFGSGVVGGNGWDSNSIPIYYREDGGATYLRSGADNSGYSALEVLQSIRDSIFGSILVTNGTTENIRATVAPSLRGSLTDNRTATGGYLNYSLTPALYVEGVSNINWFDRNGGGQPFNIERLNIAHTPQPFSRIVNNTIFGQDGRASFAADTTPSEPNDTIANAVETWQGTAQNPVAFTMTAAIGDSTQFLAPLSQDVDLYKFKLDIGERVQVNINTNNSGLDSVLQIFDSSGRPQQFTNSAGQLVTISDNDAAPGETLGVDPYIDFTATKPGVFYAAVSARNNEAFDVLSLGNRVDGSSTGAYAIDLRVLHPQEFTITVQDAGAYASGSTFTIFQVADLPNSTSNFRTFEFTRTGAVAAGNVPIQINDEYRAPDVARAIAGAINGLVNGVFVGTPVLRNIQQLPNGEFGLASPLPPVTADSLGGIDGVQSGLQLFPNRPGGHSSLGIGHNRTQSGILSNTSRGDGTTERFVKISNAAYVRSNGTVIVDPDFNANNNLDQLLPETGILVSQGATPTLLNNVFVNVQTPIVREQVFTAPPTLNLIKSSEVIIGGSIYQYIEPAAARNRLGFGIEASPTNLLNTGLDFNTIVPNNVQIFVDAQASQFLPAPNSPLIDSSLDSLEERSAIKTVKEAMGIILSPVKAPSRDATGQLRVDDPSVATPSGQGADVFKDRGALDRADFVGPSAQAVTPLDNDAGNVDRDKTVSVIQLASGVYPEFRVQLVDGFEVADPFPGIGIDDSTVIGPDIPGTRLVGAAITLFENGRVLTEGIDYRFSFNTTTNEVILTPLAGVWKNDRVYEIAVNNKNRFVLTAPAGDQVSDGDLFTITDIEGGINYFEFDSGYRLQLPQGLTLQVPLAGGATGGVADGDRFIINTGTQSVTFEFDRNGNFLAGNRPIPFVQGASQAEIATAIFAAVQSSGLPVTPRIMPNGTVFIGAETGVRLDTTFTTLSQPATTLAFKIPDLGPRPGGIVEGQTFTVSDGRRSVTFEYDTDNVVAIGNQALDFRGASTVADLADLTQTALANSGLNINPQVIGTDLIYLGLSPNGTASVGSSRLTLLGIARTLTAGQSFTIEANGVTRTFEFIRDGAAATGNIPIVAFPSESQDEIGDKVASAILGAGLGLTPTHIGDGNITVGGQESDTINVATAPSLNLFGRPGVQTNTRFQVFGPLLLNVPSRGAADLIDGSTFRVTNNGITRAFEFDNNFSGPSQFGNTVIRYNAQNNANDIALLIAAAIGNAGLGIFPVSTGAGQLSLGLIQTSQVQVLSSGLTTARGVVSDGEAFTISNGLQTVTFEFENVTFGNGFTAGNVPILFSSTSTPESVVQSMKAVIEGSGLGLTTTVFPNGLIQLNDSPKFQIDSQAAPSLIKTGVPGGANAVFFIQDANFTGADMMLSIVDAIKQAPNTPLTASIRAGDTLFVENAASISPEIENFYLRGVADLAGNLLKPNRINNETQFTILMPGVTLDYGDAPDPFTTTAGRYPTLQANDGARHVVSSTGTIILGSTITGEVNGQPTPGATGDSGDDGVTFDSDTLPRGVFNRFIDTTITVTASAPGYVDGWIDFNADGDWDDPNEKILDAVRFTSTSLIQSFQVRVPSTAPVPATATTTFARFRASTTGGLIPTGLVVNGEVEDYAVTIVPGTPPTAVNDTYTINEDSLLVTNDATGGNTPNFQIDDGIAANDADPEGGPLSVTLLTSPQFGQLILNPNGNGTFSYQPNLDFAGTDTFTYRVNDGVLTSTNIGTVTLVVSPVNDDPVGTVNSFNTEEDIALTLTSAQLLANITPGPANELNQTIQIEGVSALSARGGSVALVAGNVVYTPPTDFSGSGINADSFTITVTDNGTTGGLAAPIDIAFTVVVNVADKNDAPIFTLPKTGVTNEDEPQLFTTSFLLAGVVPGPQAEIDAGQTVTFLRVIPTSTAGGTVTVSGQNIIYTPDDDFNGTDTFFYEVQDNGTSNGVIDPQIGRGTVTVTVNPRPDAPRVTGPLGTVNMREDDPTRVIELSTVFFDPDVILNGDVLSYRVVSNSNTNLVQPTITGSQLSLQLQPDQNGQTTIVIEASDSTQPVPNTVTHQFTLVVAPVADAPRLINALPNVLANEDVNPAPITLTPTYFFDPDVLLNGDVLSFTLVSNSNPLLVTPSINNGVLSMALGANRSGISVIVIQARDTTQPSPQTVNGTFTLTVSPVNDAPVGVPDTYNVPRGTTLTTTDPRGINGVPTDDGVLANDTDVEGSTLNAVLVTQPQHGSLILNNDGTFTYVHNGLSQTTDSFVYRATDGNAVNGFSEPVTVTLNITAPPPPPHQNPQAVPGEDDFGRRDVNADGFITPIDALIVINFLRANGSRPVAGLPAPPPFRDVNGDNSITSQDALLVITYLNRRSRGNGEGEGADPAEGAAIASMMAPIVVSPMACNEVVRMQPVAPADLGVIPPVDAAGEYFAAVGEHGFADADANWLASNRQAEGEESEEIPVDLALASLLADFD